MTALALLGAFVAALITLGAGLLAYFAGWAVLDFDSAAWWIVTLVGFGLGAFFGWLVWG